MNYKMRLVVQGNMMLDKMAAVDGTLPEDLQRVRDALAQVELGGEESARASRIAARAVLRNARARARTRDRG